MQDALKDLHREKRLSRIRRFGLNLCAKIDGVTYQTSLIGLQIGYPRIAGVAIRVEHGDGPLHQMQPRCVLEAQSEKRILRLYGLVIDRYPRTLHWSVDDGKESGLLAGEGYRMFDLVLEIFA